MGNINNPFASVRGINSAGMTQREIGKRLGLTQRTMVAIKSGDRALTPETARKLAALGDGNEKPATLFLTTQVAALKSKIENEAITGAGVGRSASEIVDKLTNHFVPSDFDRSDPAYIEASEDLREIIQAIIGLIGDHEDDAEPKVATKSADGGQDGAGIARDMYGRRMPDANAPAERDMYGRRVW